jgi:hypothetical protein
MSEEDLGLEGRLRHCARYKTAKDGKKRCAKFSAGPGKPRGRKRAGIKSRFYERSTTKKRSKRVCLKRVTVKGRKVCKSWRYISAKAASKRTRKSGRKCRTWGTSKVGKRVCRAWVKARGSARRRSPLKGLSRKPLLFGVNKRGRAKVLRYQKGPGLFGEMGAARRGKKRSCARWGKGKGGRRVCRKWRTRRSR